MKEQQIDNDEKSCKNCRFYLPHYIQRTKKFVKINCGHCCKRNFKNRQPTVCRLWESDALQKAQEIQSLNQALKRMSVSLHNIEMVLKDTDLIND